MNPLSNLLKRLLQVTLVIAIFAAIIIGLFVAWWIALCVVLGVSAYLAVRRVLGGTPAARVRRTVRTVQKGAVVVEGEYRVEDESDAVARPNVLAGSDPVRHDRQP